MAAVPNGKKVEAITEWIQDVDQDELAVNAAKVALRLAQFGHGYCPLELAYHPNTKEDITGNKFEDFDGEQEDLRKEQKVSIRMPMTLFEDILIAAKKLGNRPSDIIKMAVAGMYLDSGRALLTVEDSLLLFFSQTNHVQNLRAKDRKNSTTRLRQDRRDLEQWLARYEAEGDEKAAARCRERIAAIKA